MERVVDAAPERLRAGVVCRIVEADHQHHVGGDEEAEAFGPASLGTVSRARSSG